MVGWYGQWCGQAAQATSGRVCCQIVSDGRAWRQACVRRHRIGQLAAESDTSGGSDVAANDAAPGVDLSLHRRRASGLHRLVDVSRAPRLLVECAAHVGVVEDAT
uniref:Uncharacterized protein n=1 Tax=Prymnesium polylepis TaxID=72548 RepID=A0A7S4HFW1_9EUKA